MAFPGDLKRDTPPLDNILSELHQTAGPITGDAALNERDYGELCGLNRDEARKKWGETQVMLWRRYYDIPPPGGDRLPACGPRQ